MIIHFKSGRLKKAAKQPVVDCRWKIFLPDPAVMHRLHPKVCLNVSDRSYDIFEMILNTGHRCTPLGEVIVKEPGKFHSVLKADFLVDENHAQKV